MNKLYHGLEHGQQRMDFVAINPLARRTGQLFSRTEQDGKDCGIYCIICTLCRPDVYLPTYLSRSVPLLGRQNGICLVWSRVIIKSFPASILCHCPAQ